MKHLYKKIAILASLLFLASGCDQLTPNNNYTRGLQVGSAKIFVEVADTAAKKTQGLSDREKLTEAQGMLFDFRADGEVRPIFWMKDMKFDLDLIWIRQGEIIFVTPNVPVPRAGEGLTEYYPPSEIDMVLEVNAGWSERNEIKIGDLVFLH